MAPIVHVVLFHFKDEVTGEQRKELCAKMLSLKNNCIHPTSKQPYIKTSVGGVDNSIEGMQHGTTHAFVVEFESEEDRNYYVKEDPVHATFVKEVLRALVKATIIDFTPGLF